MAIDSTERVRRVSRAQTMAWHGSLHIHPGVWRSPYLLGGFPIAPWSFHTVHSRIDFRIMGLLFGTKQQTSLVPTTASAAFRIWSFWFIAICCFYPHTPHPYRLSLIARTQRLYALLWLPERFMLNGYTKWSLIFDPRYRDLERAAHVLVCSLCTMIPSHIN